MGCAGVAPWATPLAPLAGTVPVSADGNIRIRGRINAVEAVRLMGQNVTVGTPREAINRLQATTFASTVNSKGLNDSGDPHHRVDCAGPRLWTGCSVRSGHRTFVRRGALLWGACSGCWPRSPSW